MRGCILEPNCTINQSCNEGAQTCGPACAIPDFDGDGRDSVECGGDDCDDTDANRFPGNREVCDDGHDEDCDPLTIGERDDDGDGEPSSQCCNLGPSGVPTCGTDCDDTDITVRTSQLEICDQVDNDCDGMVDEERNIVPWFADEDRDGFGARGDPTTMSCEVVEGASLLDSDCDDADRDINPTRDEVCNGVDDDCDGETDEGCDPIVIGDVQLSVPAIDYGDVLVDVAVEPQPLEIDNLSSRDIAITLLPGGNVRRCDGPDEGEAFCVEARDGFDDEDRIRVSAQQAALLDVAFIADEVGAVESGAMRLQVCDGDSFDCVAVVTLDGAIVDQGVSCTPGALDFPAILPGRSVTLSITCSAVAHVPVTLVDRSLAGGASSPFATEPATPDDIAPGANRSFDVRFEPETLGDVEDSLRIEVLPRGGFAEFVDIRLSGVGGGPAVTVSPARLDFGVGSLIGAGGRLVLEVGNEGLDPLEVSEVSVPGRTDFRVIDGGGAATVQPGDTVDVTVEFTPAIEGDRSSTLEVRSNDGVAPIRPVPLTGRGISLPPCSFDAPSAVDVALVPVGRRAVTHFEVQNLSSTSQCLITQPRLLPGSSTNFAVTSSVGILGPLIPAGASRVLSVAFTPEQSVARSAQLEFGISSPATPFPTVGLSGAGSLTELSIYPPTIDFGVIELGCNARTIETVLANRGEGDITIDSIVEPVGSNVSVARRPDLPTTLSAGQSVSFDVGYFAPLVSDDAGRVRIDYRENSEARTRYVEVKGRGEIDAVTVDRFRVLPSDEVDVLFVVSNVPSMSQELDDLGDEFAALVRFADAEGLDYNIGITTTDVDDEAGRLVSATSGTTGQSAVNGPASLRVLTRSTPNVAGVFDASLSLPPSGTGTDDTAGLAALSASLAPGLLTGHNVGFRRPDATLSVIFVADGDDTSSDVSWDDVVRLLGELEGSTRTNRTTIATITGGETGCSGPSGSAVAAPTYRSFAEVEASVCTTNWARTLDDPAFWGLRRLYYLTNQPVIQTIEVFINGARIPGTESTGNVNWTYDFPKNAVEFADGFSLVSGDDILVEYTAECL